MTKINRVVLSVYASRIFARSRHLPQPRYDIFKRSETWNSSLRCIKFCETKTPRTKRTIHRNCYWEVKKIRQRRREIWKGYTLPKLNEAGRRWVCKYEFHFVFSKPVGHSSHSLLPVAPLRFLKCSSLSGAYKTVTSKSNTIIVSFETRNLCTFLLGLFRSIISSLVNDYYFISFFYLNQFHLSTCTRYYISYFIAISCCRHHQFCLLFMYDPLLAIYLQSLGARPISYLRYFLFFLMRISIDFFFDTYIDLHFSGIFS